MADTSVLKYEISVGAEEYVKNHEIRSEQTPVEASAASVLKHDISVGAEEYDFTEDEKHALRSEQTLVEASPASMLKYEFSVGDEEYDFTEDEKHALRREQTFVVASPASMLKYEFSVEAEEWDFTEDNKHELRYEQTLAEASAASVLKYEFSVGDEEYDFTEDNKHALRSEQTLVEASAASVLKYEFSVGDEEYDFTEDNKHALRSEQTLVEASAASMLKYEFSVGDEEYDFTEDNKHALKSEQTLVEASPASMLKYEFSVGAEECHYTGNKKHELRCEQTLVEASAASVLKYDISVETDECECDFIADKKHELKREQSLVKAIAASGLKYEFSVGDEECDFTGDKKHELRSEQSLVEASAASVLKYEISVGTEECDFTGDKKHELRSEQTLVEASAAGNSEKVIELLSSGVLVDAEEYNKLLFYASKNYMTPLQLASANGHIECVQILLAHGADVNAKDRFDVTALHMAAEKGHYLCLKALLDGGADCCLPTKFSKSGCYRAVPHLGGTTPLHLAAANNRVDCVKELIQYGADYNAIDECGRTSLYIATNLGFRECVLAHLKNAVGRDILSLPDFETGDTPLHFAVLHRMTDCVHELLSLGSDVNHINNLGCSPLHISLIPTGKVNDMEILKLLVLEGYNTNINLPDAGGYLPLHYVCFSGQNQRWLRRPEMAKFLIAHGANVNIKNYRGISLLHCELRASEKEYEILKFIVNSMLQLPHVRELNRPSQRESRPTAAAAAVAAAVTNRNRNPNLENDILVNYRRLFHAPSNIPPHIHSYDPREPREMNIILELFTRPRDPPSWRNQDLNPFLDHVYNIYEGNIFSNVERSEEDNAVEIANWDLLLMEKKLWYDQIALNPRTLQHCCRYVVRQTLGSHKLKDVGKLPIPAALKSYMLLDCNE